MATEEKSEISLSELFDRALALHDEIENSTVESSSSEYQTKVQKCILMLEDATRLVSLLDLFSRNENYKEISTEHLKYFLLPVLLGDLNARITGVERADAVETCQIYYIDFLRRMVDYEFTEVNVPKLKQLQVDGEEGEGEEGAVTRSTTQSRMPDLNAMNKEREEKMSRFREKKQLETEIKNLKGLINPGTRDEDLEKRLYINMIRRFIHVASEEIQSLQMETDILRHMASIKAGKIAPEPEKKSRPFQPIIITKDKLQKEVYGLGYPSLPVLSVDEFYDQRVREGWFPPTGQGRSLQNTAVKPEEVARQEDEHYRTEEDKEERDDEQELARKRAFDDWKDEHRRGEGNRKNMG